MPVVPVLPTVVGGVYQTSAVAALVAAVGFLQAPPIAELRQTVVQSIPNGTFTAINFDVEDVDSAGGHDNVTNNSRYTAVYTGWYQVSGGVEFEVNVVGIRAVYIYVNGAVTSGSQSIAVTTGASGNHGQLARTKHVFLNVGDYVELWCYQTSGAALNTAVTGGAGTTDQSSMTVRWVSN